jgi:hypothetical protein
MKGPVLASEVTGAVLAGSTIRLRSSPIGLHSSAERANSATYRNSARGHLSW